MHYRHVLALRANIIFSAKLAKSVRRTLKATSNHPTLGSLGSSKYDYKKSASILRSIALRLHEAENEQKIF